MALRLSRAASGPRSIDVGFGVVFRFRQFGFADYREAEAWAQRNARDQLTGPQKAALAGQEIDELGDEFQDRLIGLASEMHLDRLVTKFVEGWSGVLIGESADDQEELPFSIDNWQLFKDQMPVIVDRLDRALMAPMHAVVTEGNGFAPLPGTDTPAG
jgi:hypothetical protein